MIDIENSKLCKIKRANTDWWINERAVVADNGKTCVTRIMEDDEYLESLNIKMQEELKEYLESGDVEELADLEEVLRAILDVKKVTYEKFENIRNAQVEKRGAFKDKIFLESVSDE